MLHYALFALYNIIRNEIENVFLSRKADTQEPNISPLSLTISLRDIIELHHYVTLRCIKLGNVTLRNVTSLFSPISQLSENSPISGLTALFLLPNILMLQRQVPEGDSVQRFTGALPCHMIVLQERNHVT